MALDEEELYQEHILEHYEDPYHRGKPTRCTHFHEDDNPLCGDHVEMSLEIDDRGIAPRSVFRRRRLLHQSGRGLDAGRALRSAHGRGGQAVHGRGHAQALRRAPDAQPAEVLPATVASAPGGDLFSGPANSHRGGQQRKRNIMTTTIEPTCLDPQRYRPDFPILSQPDSRRDVRWSISTTPRPRSARAR